MGQMAIRTNTSYEDIVSAAVWACSQIVWPSAATLDAQALDDVFTGALNARRSPRLRASGTDVAAQIVTRHANGERVGELAEHYGLHRATIGRILKQAGVETPTQRLEHQLDQVRAVYESGETLDRTARQFGVSRGAVHRLLIKYGIPRRNGKNQPG
jgi:DNA invertase Pin-like site-specific DNA recombinase